MKKSILILFLIAANSWTKPELVQPDQSQVGLITANQFGAKGDGKSDDTAALQQAIDYCGTHHRALHLLGGTYLTTSTLLLKFYPGLVISGEGWSNTEIRARSDGQPIIRTTAQDTHSVIIEKLKLSYEHPQSQGTNQNSYGIEFSDNRANGSGFYHWLLSQVWIENAAVAIGEDQQSGKAFPVWGCRFQDILITHVFNTAILLKQPGGVHSGQPSNSFDNIKILNKGASNSGPVIDLIGEWRITNLDVEDCQNSIISSDSSFDGYLSSVHIERHKIFGTETRLFAFYDGDYQVEAVAFNAFNKPGNAFCFIHAGRGNSTVNLRGLSFGGAAPETYADVSILCGSPRSATVRSIRVTAAEDKLPPKFATAIRDQEVKR